MSPKKRTMLALAAAATLSLLALTGFTIVNVNAQDEPDAPGHRPGCGHPGRHLAEIVAIDAGDQTVVVRRGANEATLQITDETELRVIGVEAPTLDSISVGDRAFLRAPRPGSDQGGADAPLVASFLGLVPDGERVAGRVTAVSDTSITLQRRGGTELEVAVAADTWLARAGEDYAWLGEPAGRDLLTAGAWLVAFGELDESGQTLAAHTLIALRWPAAVP
ncbi:MAG: hypothetical protein ACRDHL_04790 [Candidatus Promineifilaceae bacterium]